MGKFANPPQDGATRLYPDVSKGDPYNGASGFAALGSPVPFFRRSAAMQHLRSMGFTDRERMDRIVGKMSARIERDDSHMALEDGLQMGLDVTGCYRLLAVLLSAERPAEPEERPVEATYLDLVEQTA